MKSTTTATGTARRVASAAIVGALGFSLVAGCPPSLEEPTRDDVIAACEDAVETRRYQRSTCDDVESATR